MKERSCETCVYKISQQYKDVSRCVECLNTQNFAYYKTIEAAVKSAKEMRV